MTAYYDVFINIQWFSVHVEINCNWSKNKCQYLYKPQNK